MDRFSELEEIISTHGGLDSEEFRTWLEDENNRLLFEQLLIMREAAVHVDNNDTLNVNKQWNKVLRNITDGKKSSQKRRALTYSLAIASAVAAVIAIAVLLMPSRKVDNQLEPQLSGVTITTSSGQTINISNDQQVIELLAAEGAKIKNGEICYSETESQSETEIKTEITTVMMHTLETKAGYSYRIILDDGTVVWVNAESTLCYPTKFTGDKRQLFLDGEAFFEVTYNPDMPFEIRTSDGPVIAVLGTKFNVNAYHESEYYRITLAEGAVAVNFSDESVTLTPNRQAIFERDNGTLTDIEVDDAWDAYAWTTGHFYFISASLKEIFETIERWYGITINYAGLDVSELGNFNLKADRTENFERIFEVLSDITNLNYRIEESVVYIE